MKTIMNWFKAAPKINKIAYWICLILSIGLIIGGFLVPPLGLIDASVLTAVGELFGFAALGTGITAIERGYDVTVKKGDAEITISDDEK